MKTLITFFVLFFSSSVLSEDISDFHIEGISIGDSLLDYFSEEKIIDSKKTEVVGRFYYVEISDKKINQYDLMQFYLKSNDDNYEIYAIVGGIFFDIIQECKLKKKEVLKELEKVLDLKFKTGELKHQFDKSGKSIQHQSYYLFEDRSNIRVECYEWSNQIKKQYNWGDHLSFSLFSKEVQNWIDDGYN